MDLKCEELDIFSQQADIEVWTFMCEVAGSNSG
jgi:hypothetical protein